MASVLAVGDVEGQNSEKFERVYKREHSLYINVEDNKAVKPGDVIEAITDLCGAKSLFACIPKSGNLYEVTVCDKVVTDFLLDGLCCNGKTYECKPVVNDKLLVSFLQVPTYIEDREIEEKLEELEVEVTTPINRKCYPGTEIEDGTRMCTVKLPKKMCSLPYLVKLSDGHTTANYRAVHDNQLKMCNNCYSLSHLYRDCPEVTCFRCNLKGHFKWNCQAKRCENCYKFVCGCVVESTENAKQSNYVDSQRTNTVSDDESDDEDNFDDNEEEQKDKLEIPDRTKDRHVENSDFLVDFTILPVEDPTPILQADKVDKGKKLTLATAERDEMDTAEYSETDKATTTHSRRHKRKTVKAKVNGDSKPCERITQKKAKTTEVKKQTIASEEVKEQMKKNSGGKNGQKVDKNKK